MLLSGEPTRVLRVSRLAIPQNTILHYEFYFFLFQIKKNFCCLLFDWNEHSITSIPAFYYIMSRCAHKDCLVYKYIPFWPWLLFNIKNIALTYFAIRTVWIVTSIWHWWWITIWHCCVIVVALRAGWRT